MKESEYIEYLSHMLDESFDDGKDNYGYVIMAMSSMGYPIFPFSINTSFSGAKTAVDEDNDEFDKNFMEIFDNVMHKFKPEERLIKANLHGLGLNTMFPVSVFKTAETAEHAMRKCEIGDSGQQYQAWKYIE